MAKRPPIRLPRQGTVNLREIVLLKANRETRKRPISGHLQRFPVSSEASKLLKLTVPVVQLPPRSPNLNAYAERFVRSIKDECLNRMIFFGERSLRKATREYAAHYHRERNHQGLDNRLIEPPDRAESGSSAIKCSQRLGGMLRFYHRAAA